MTVIIKKQEELEALIRGGNIIINDNLVIECDINIEAHISAIDITARDINAWNIKARNIDAFDIKAMKIDARNIFYYAVCYAYINIKCKSIKGRRKNSKHFCLDGKIVFKEEEILDNFEKVFNETEKFTEAVEKAFDTIPEGYLHDKS